MQTGITGALVSGTYGLNYVLMTVIAGLLYIGITFIGVRGLHYIGLVSIPLFVVLGLWWPLDAASDDDVGRAIMAYAGNNGAATMSMGVGADGGDRAVHRRRHGDADFNRWARTRRDLRWIATFSAFPFANMVAMLVGGVMTAALAVPNANPFGADNMFGYMNHMQIGWLSVLAFLFLYLQPRLGLLALPVQLGHRLVAHHRHAYAARGGGARRDRHRGRRRQHLGVLHPVAAACSACWSRRSARSSWSTNTSCDPDAKMAADYRPTAFVGLGDRIGRRSSGRERGAAILDGDLLDGRRRRRLLRLLGAPEAGRGSGLKRVSAPERNYRSIGRCRETGGDHGLKPAGQRASRLCQ